MEVCLIKLEVPWNFVLVVVGFVMIWVVRRYNEGCKAMCIDGVWTLCLASSTALHILRPQLFQNADVCSIKGSRSDGNL